MRIRGLLFLLVSLSFVFNSCTDNQESIIGFDENYSVAQETGLFYRLDDEKLIEHAKIEGASFIVFMDSSYVSKARGSSARG